MTIYTIFLNFYKTYICLNLLNSIVQDGLKRLELLFYVHDLVSGYFIYRTLDFLLFIPLTTGIIFNLLSSTSISSILFVLISYILNLAVGL